MADEKGLDTRERMDMQVAYTSQKQKKGQIPFLLSNPITRARKP